MPEEDNMGAIASILEEKDTTIRAVGPEATVFDAVGEMCRNHLEGARVTARERPRLRPRAYSPFRATQGALGDAAAACESFSRDGARPS